EPGYWSQPNLISGYGRAHLKAVRRDPFPNLRNGRRPWTCRRTNRRAQRADEGLACRTARGHVLDAIHAGTLRSKPPGAGTAVHSLGRGNGRESAMRATSMLLGYSPP